MLKQWLHFHHRTYKTFCFHIPDRFIEYALQVSLGQGRTFQVLVCSDLLRNNQGLVIRDWLHTLLSQAFECGWVLSQIEFRTNEDDGDRRGMVIDLGEPLEQ